LLQALIIFLRLTGILIENEKANSKTNHLIIDAENTWYQVATKENLLQFPLHYPSTTPNQTKNTVWLFRVLVW